MACNRKELGDCDLPAPVADVYYTQIAPGACHTAVLRSGGSPGAWGGNEEAQCVLPALDADEGYPQVRAGERHAAALRSDGSAAA